MDAKENTQCASQKRGLGSFVKDFFRLHPCAALLFIVGFIFTGLLDASAMCSLYPIMDTLTGGKTENRLVHGINSFLNWMYGEPNFIAYIFVFLCISLFAGFVHIGLELYKGFFLRRIEASLRDTFTHRVLSTSWIDLAKFSHGHFSNALLKDVDSAIRAYLHLLTALGMGATALLLFAVMLVIHQNFTLVTICSLGVIYFCLNPLIRITHKFGERFVNEGAQLAIVLNNVARAFKEIKAVSNEVETLQHLKSFYRKIEYSMMMLNTNLVAVRNKTFEFAGLMVLCFLIYMGLYHFEITPSNLLILIALLIRFIPLVSSSLGQISISMSFLPGFHHINELLNFSGFQTILEEPELKKSLTNIQCLELKNCNFSYEDQRPILKDFNLKINHGEICVIKGGSGTGKSTILDLLSGLLTPQYGHASANGIALSELNTIKLHQQLVYLPQFCFVFADTLRVNILWGGGDPKNLSEAVIKAQLHDYVEEKSLDYLLSESGQNLSGGQRQRIGLARAFAKNGDFLLLDEPTSALDVETEIKIVEALGQLKGKIGVVIVTHREEVLKIADRIIDLDHLSDEKSR
jgi:ATP-binding cassette, subfamily C, bacterial